MTDRNNLSGQWANPGDIMSLLLLLGGDVVQKALAQLVGPRIRFPWGSSLGLAISPVVFSFGWGAYAFSNLVSVAGDMRLMPPNDYPSTLVTCSNGFVRETRSWVLGRLLRDHEITCDTDAGKAQMPRISLRVDVFQVGPVEGPTRDAVWWSGWATMVMQMGVAITPWILYKDWAILVVAVCGNVLALMTSAIPQWTQEKWAAPVLRKEQVTCLTRGNGHRNIMVLISAPGALDLECLATGTVPPRKETGWILQTLALMWTCLVITVSGLRENTWFIIAIGALGMVQNVFAAGCRRKPDASNFHLTRDKTVSTIFGLPGSYKDDPDCSVDLDEATRDLDDTAAWVYGKHNVSDPRNIAGPMLMPEWLESFSKVDGVPHWLEAIQPVASEPTSRSPKVQKLVSLPKVLFDTAKNKAGTIVEAIGVHGALTELEKHVPTAGLAMMQIYFLGGLQYNEASVRDNVHKKFWTRAYHTQVLRKKAAEKRRSNIREASQPLY